MSNTKNIILVFTIGLLLISCGEDFFEKPIDLDINDHKSKIAATALLGATDETNLVLASYSLGPFESSDNQTLNNATVTLTDGNNTISFNTTAQEGFYEPNTNINFIPNTAYTLTIDAPNYNSITATQVYPESVPIIEASLTENTFKIKINDNPNQKDFYLLQLQRQDNNGGTEFYNKEIDPFGSLTKSSGFCDTCLSFNDETFNGEQNFEIVVTNYYYDSDTTYKAILYHITEDFYKYDRSLFRSIYAQDNPFVEPVILHRNFENGYGIFGLVNKSELTF